MNIKDKIKSISLLTLVVIFSSCSQNIQKISFKEKESESVSNSLDKKKMKIEIWSDVMCPFCYIGKRKFEAALDKFEHKDDVEIIWKSYQLDPSMQYQENKSINEYLAERKGWTLDYARQMNDHVTSMASEVGLTYDFDKAKVANSFDAHRFSHLAAKHGLQDEAEERLFKAYFTDGLNIGEKNVLTKLGTEIGLDSTEVKNVLASNEYAADVQKDIMDADRIGVRGVPFFVANQKYAVSGAQDSKVFLQFLQKAWSEEFENEKAKQSKGGGECEDGVCKPTK